MLCSVRLKSLFAIVLIASLGACSKDAADTDAFTDADGPLRYVDANTPYLMASLEPLPDDVYDKIEPRMDKLLKSYQDIIRLSVRQGLVEAELAGESADLEEERVLAVIDRVIGLFSADGMRSAGIDRNSTFMIYGSGLLPVMRISLSDVGAFEKTLADFEAEAGNELQQARLDDLTYRFAGDEQARVVLAITDDQLVASIVPTQLGEDSLREVFGLKLPADSIAKSGRLEKIATTFGFSGRGAGFVDFEKIANVFLDEQSGVNAELLALAEFDAPPLSDVCKAEIRGMAGIAPRLVTGYTEFSEERIASTTVLELRSDIADGLATLPALVPGLGMDHGGLMSFGMSIDLLAAREFYAARLDAIEANPYKCELFAEMQANIAQGRAVLNQPVPPIVYGLKGFLAIVDNIEGLDMATKQPPTEIDMRFLLATENAPGLVAMGSMFSPELATLNLQADGKAVRFESPQMQGPVDEAWVAMNNGAIALAVGNGAESTVGTMLDAAAGSPPPAFAMHMDAARYYGFIGDAVTMRPDNQMSPELGEAVGELMQNLAALIDRVAVTMNFTDRGVEIPTVTTLKD